MEVFVLTYEYMDHSGFHVCGVTRLEAVANAWRAAGCGEHKVYKITEDEVMPAVQGHPEWK